MPTPFRLAAMCLRQLAGKENGLVLLLFLLAVNLASLPRSEAVEVVNGTIVANPLKKFSFFALPTSSENSDSWLGCGASIISPTHALTSAHCFGGGTLPCSSPKKLGIWVGDLEIKANLISPKNADRSFRTTAEVHCHTSFDGKCSHGHDLALLKLAKPVPSWVKPVPLNLKGEGKDQEKDELTIVGYGLFETSSDISLISETTSSKMRQAAVSVFSSASKACGTVFGGGWGCSDAASEGSAKNKDQQLCAGSMPSDGKTHDTCAGDSGSPILDKNGVQVGIVSYGGGPGEKRSGPGRSCGDPNYPGVYARVSAFSAYIKAQVPDLPSTSAISMNSLSYHDDNAESDHDHDHDHDHDEEESSSSACSESHHHDHDEEEKEYGLDVSKGLATFFVLVSAVVGISLWAKCPVLNSPKFISYINVLTGGMFIGMGLFHILPESIEHMPCSMATMFTGEESSVAVVFFVFVGFVLVLFFERVLMHWKTSRESEKAPTADARNDAIVMGNPTEVDATNAKPAEGAVQDECRDHHHHHIPDTTGTGAVLLLASLSVHSVFEGIVIGTAETVSTVWILAFIVVAHKWAAAFSIASRLPAEQKKKRFALVLLAFFCLASPLGTLLGWVIDTMAEDSEGQAALFVEVTLNCVAVGTLLYIGFVEVVAEEFSSPRNVMTRFGLFTGAAAAMFGLTLLHLEYGHHHHDE
mmetsp:Transcript_58032/g.127229  ORF Transcript_58032/g.127229 Transcript_58032/m.127229 type:complete len:698 (-) Transcript_58032:509-2602(-)